MRLSEEEQDLCRKAFAKFDRDGSGTIDVRELRTALEAMGQHPTEEEVFVMIHDVDEDNSGEIEFSEFCRVIEKHKEASASNSNEQDTLDAFVALGGNSDKTGRISSDKLRATIKAFELTLDIERLIQEVDTDRSGFLEYKEFKAILS